MTLTQYLKGMQDATTASELEAAIQAPFKHPYSGRIWSTICKARIAKGLEICDTHPHGRLVPRLNGRLLSVCGETYKTGRAHNSTGQRYVWHSAGEFAKSVMIRNGLSIRAANQIWGHWSAYPHRCLRIVDEALQGNLDDPPMDTLIFSYMGVGPVNITVEQNDAEAHSRRATENCQCGGTLFDWGCGFGDGFTYINWHCNQCARVFTEYVTAERMAKLRQPWPFQQASFGR